MSTDPNDVKGAAAAAEVKAMASRARAEKRAEAVKAAIEIMRSEGVPRDATGADTAVKVLKLAKTLKKFDEFGYAWRILVKARKELPGILNHPDYLEIVQKSALYTYKDVNLPLEKRLNDALDILRDYAALERTEDKETLGLAGAIYKRKWEADNRRESLEWSLRYYEKGYKGEPAREFADQGYTGVNADQGYTAINAAYVLDLLAEQEAKAKPADAGRHRAAARALRERIVAEVPLLIEPPLDGAKPLAKVTSNADFKGYWFFYSTVGEAYFGLGNYGAAHDWLVTRPEAANAEPDGWEFETTARQLASLAHLQIAAAPTAGKRFEEERSWLAVEEFLKESKWAGPGGVSSSAVRHGFEGKIGLGLSGGGFRASLFHIGVLARLAELDVLRRVEVISCVSGGSIVGTHYYLEVQELLRRTPDGQITKGDYIEIVRRLEERFLAGVQRNIRMRVAEDFKAALKMLLKPGYTRTIRLGELYEEELYSQVNDRAGDDKKKPRYMHELKISPRLSEGGQWDDFKPKFHNWRREAKAPILVINAATLNTGHNWQFTATYMGESPAAIHSEIDNVYRLRRKFYTDGPDREGEPQEVRLGTAVAASSCVPALFEPVMLDDAYERGGEGGGPSRRVDVRLVDGGVCDNQGVSSLLEQDCNVLLVSDGSGHLEPVDAPGTAALPVASRSNGVLQARIRGTQYRELDARRRTSLVRELMFVHLKKDLDNSPVDWKDCPAELKVVPPSVNADMTGYRVPKEVQKRLARIRTDLDTFCDVESHALMVSGYLMTEADYPAPAGAAGPPHNEAGWRFMWIEELLKNTNNTYRDQHRRLKEVLDAGASRGFKVWKLSPGLKTLARVMTWLGILLGLGVPVVLLSLAVYAWRTPDWWKASLVPSDWLPRAGASVTPGLLVTLLGLLVVSIVALVLAALLIHLVGRRLLGVTSWLDTVARKVVAALLLFVGYPVAKIHLRFFDPKYKKCGGVEGLTGPAAQAGD